MKFQYFSIIILTFLVAVSSCKSDDDGDSLLPQEQQNSLDDQAIIKFLQDHYFNTVGKVTKFRDDISSDDDQTPLYDIAEQDPTGYWYVKKPGFEATGRQITNVDSDSILLQYELNGFVARTTNDSVFYGLPHSISTTINTTGYPIWDPAFYYKDVSEMSNAEERWYEMEGVRDGLMHFNSTNKLPGDMPAVDFQGLIIAPSRLAFKRDYNVFNLAPDTSVYINFELYQVVDRQ